MIRLDQHTFVAFDLDDTLYPEDAYHDSGLRAVSEVVHELYGVHPLQKLRQWKENGRKDLWDLLCAEVEMSPTAKESIIWLYRLHRPKISLDPATRAVINVLDTQLRGLAIVTDGRSITQRFKLAALGLSHFPVYISEEWNSQKPDTKRFEAIMSRFPAGQYVYVGENPAKDFKGPNELGWITIGIRGDGRNVHSQDTAHLAKIYHPDQWINRCEQLDDYLC